MLFTLFACTEEDTGSCIAQLSFVFPSGEESSIDFCAAYTMDAEYEFDPDDAPEVRNATLRLYATTEEGFECWVILQEEGACGEGEYRIGDGSTHVTIDTSDCTGAPDLYEGERLTSEGSVVFETIEAGDEPGNFTGEPLATRIAGTLDVTDAMGVVLGGAFDVTTDVVAGDAEESVCARVE